MASTTLHAKGPPPAVPAALRILLLAVASLAAWSISAWKEADVAETARFGPRALLQASRGLSLLLILHRLWLSLNRATIYMKIHFDQGSWFTPREIRVTRWVTLTMFTNQSWILLGAYFAAALARHVVARPLFGVAFASSHIVSALSTWVLIPLAVNDCDKTGADIAANPFFSPDCLWFHNANVLFVHLDMFLSTRRVLFADLGCSALFACWYALFAWVYSRFSHYVAYPFIDYTLPLHKSFPVHLALIALLVIFHALGVALSSALSSALNPLLRLAAHLLILRAVTCVKPPSVSINPRAAPTATPAAKAD